MNNIQLNFLIKKNRLTNGHTINFNFAKADFDI